MAGNDLGEVVAQLVVDMSTLRQELLGQRWQHVADNFVQIVDNFQKLHERVEALENVAELRRVDRGDGAD